MIKKNQNGGKAVNLKKIALTTLRCIVIFAAAAVLFLVLSNAIVVGTTKNRIYSYREAVEEQLEAYDAILVLGCSVHPDKTPSLMLRDRLDTAIAIYEYGAAPKILLSGDRSENYDEVTVMRNYMLEHGVPEEAILEDGEGYSTYESVYRAAHTFGLKKMLVVTQHYHLYRALYIARCLGTEAAGIATDEITYGGQLVRDVREILARSKDCLQCVFKPAA